VQRRVLGTTALIAVALLAGCREAPPTPPKTEVAQASGDPRAEGDAAALRGDWATAAARYRDALQLSPNELALHFALGSAFSQLDRRVDAIEEFSWVVQHGEPSRPEVVAARRWLQQATGFRSPEENRQSATDSARDTSAGATSVIPDARVGLVEGRTEWPGLGPHEKRRLSVRLQLRGEGETNANITKRLHMEIGMPFELGRVPPGNYRLVGESRGVTLWDVPLAVEADKTTNVELSPGNSSVRPSDFPPSG